MFPVTKSKNSSQTLGLLFTGAEASSWYVSRFTGDDTAGCGKEKNSPCKSIAMATHKAQQGDSVYLDGTNSEHDPYPCTNLSSHVVRVFSSYGDSQAFIRCVNNYSFQFVCTNTFTNVSLEGLVFNNTAVTLFNCSLLLRNCSFCTFSKEITAPLNLKFDGITNGNIVVDRCLFEDNLAGCVNISGNNIDLTVRNTTFQRNRIASLGNAIFQLTSAAAENSQSAHNVRFYNVTFENNTGRAVWFHSGSSLNVSITNGTFINNTALNSRENGGALWVSKFNYTTVEVCNSRFTENKASACGGAIGLTDLKNLLLYVNNSKFIKNQAGSKGGALAIGCDEMEPKLNISVFINNTYFTANSMLNATTCVAAKTGGAAFSIAFSLIHQLSIERTNFSHNKSPSCHTGALLIGSTSSLYKGIISNSYFVNNSASSGSSCSTIAVFLPKKGNGNLELSGVTFEKNGGQSRYDVWLSGMHTFVNSCTFQNNSGGGVFIGSHTEQDLVVIQNSKFANNSNFTLSIQSYGQASEYTLKNVTFMNNNCLVGPRNPPIIELRMFSSDSVINISKCKFYNNTCDLSVVKVTVQSNSSVPHYNEGCTVRTNTSVTQDDPSKVNIINSEFTDNCGMSESTLTLQNGKVALIGNIFTNSFGFVSGSHLTVMDGSAAVDIINTTFLQTLKKKKIWGREVPFNSMLSITSCGRLNVANGSSFKSVPFGDVDPLIIVRGPNEVFIDSSSRVECSYGSKLEINNFTDCEDFRGKKQYVRIKTFTFVCRACAVGTYSILKGFSSGFQIQQHVTCKHCPPGANCTRNLASQPNFWGHPVANDEVEFIDCPPGYCCPHSCRYRNNTFNSTGCQGNRTGTLCGTCQEDFTETFFSSKCQQKSRCNDWWVWLLALSCISLFALYLIHKPPVVQLVWRNLFWFSRAQKTNAVVNHKQQSLGFMKILFYFYQIAGLVTLPSNGTSTDFRDYIVFPVVGLFNFRFYDMNRDFSVCPYQGLTQELKTSLPLFGVLTLHLSVLCIYLLHMGVNKLFKRPTVYPPSDAYLAASMECLLLSYSAFTYTLIKLLRWVSIEGQTRWYYNATIPMNPLQWWQGASVACILVFVVPFIFVLFVGSRKLYRGLIPPGHFVLACYFPLPFLIYWVVRSCCHDMARKSSAQEMAATSIMAGEDLDKYNSTNVDNMTALHSSVLEVISAPFRKPKHQKSLGMVHWESVLIGRRFLLIATALFSPNEFLASMCLTILCLLALLHHVLRKPFANYYANATETTSLVTLVVIATINIDLGAFYPTGIQVPTSQEKYITAFLYVEAVLLGAVPVAFILVATVSCISQVFRMLLFLTKLICLTLNKQCSLLRDDSTREPLLS